MSLSSIYLNKVTEETFEEVVFNVSVDKVVLVYFWSTWCQRCKMMGPILDTIKESYKGSVILASVDVTLHYPLAMQFGIQGLPALVFFKDAPAKS